MQRGIHLADVQLALFADVGAAGNDRAAMFRPIIGYGAGIRFFLEIMAVGQSMVGIDVAGRSDDPRSPQASDAKTEVKIGSTFHHEDTKSQSHEKEHG